MTGIELIAAERQRQIDKGHTADHDREQHGRAGLHRAAQAYLDNEPTRLPWSAPLDWWDMLTRERLIKAGALIAAALDVMEDTA